MDAEGVNSAVSAREVFVLASLAQKAGNHTLAKTAWSKYAIIRPLDPRGHHNLATCLKALGRDEAALESYGQAFALGSSSMADAAANAAGLLIKAGHSADAVSLCYRALEGSPECTAALYNLNTALRMKGRQLEAIHFSRRWILQRLPTGSCAHERWDASAGSCRDAASAPAAGVDTAAQEGCTDEGTGTAPPRDGHADSLTVVCVKWGTRYGPEYVERLARGVRRNLSRPHEFVCFTDDVDALRAMDGLKAKPLGRQGAGMAGGTGWHGWWNKAFLFSREAGLEGRVLYIDLDTVIAGSLDDIAGFSGGFAALSAAGMANERRPSGINSSVMAWDAGDLGALSDTHRILQDAFEVVTKCLYKFDHWLEMTVDTAGVHLQEAFPGQIVEYAADCRNARPASVRAHSSSKQDDAASGRDSVHDDGERGPLDSSRDGHEHGERAYGRCHDGGTGELVTEEGAGTNRPPDDARIVCFPLRPKPHELLGQAWVRRLWVGIDADRDKHRAYPRPRLTALR